MKSYPWLLLVLLGFSCSSEQGAPQPPAECGKGEVRICDCPWLEKPPDQFCLDGRWDFYPCDCDEDKRAINTCDRAPEYDYLCKIKSEIVGSGQVIESYPFGFINCPEYPVDSNGTVYTEKNVFVWCSYMGEDEQTK